MGNTEVLADWQDILVMLSAAFTPLPVVSRVLLLENTFNCRKSAGVIHRVFKLTLKGTAALLYLQHLHSSS